MQGVMKTCLKCSYTRKPDDTAPMAECPRCGAVYAKVEQAAAQGKQLRPAPVVRAALAPVDFSKPVQVAADPAPSASAVQEPETASLLTACRTCAKQVSRTAKMCPHCGEDQPAGKVDLPPASAVAALSRPAKKPTSGGTWLVAIMVGLLVVGKFASSDSNSPSDSPRPFDEFSAYWLCKTTIERASRDPDKAEIPKVPSLAGSADYLFVWGYNTQHMRLRNGLGLDVATTGACAVDRSTQQITRLVLDGKAYIGS